MRVPALFYALLVLVIAAVAFVVAATGGAGPLVRDSCETAAADYARATARLEDARGLDGAVAAVMDWTEARDTLNACG
jgi:hypothetical protein